MHSLREIQGSLAAALAGGDPAAAGRLLRGSPELAAARIAVYANNSWMAFRNTLELSFPAVARLGGPEWFSGAARSYRAGHPSRSGNLQGVGGSFPAFLAKQLAGTAHAVIADVAALEWAYQEVLVAPEPTPFDPRVLAAVPAERCAELCFPLAAACRLVSSPWPVLAIWRANREEAEPVPTIDLDAGGDRLLLRRAGLEVELTRLDEAEWIFLAALAAGRTLGVAAERAGAGDPAFDLAAVLERHVRRGTLATATLPDFPSANGDSA